MSDRPEAGPEENSEEDRLIAEVVSAHRPRSGDGQLRYHPAWADLSAAGRERAHAVTIGVRAAEAALDPEGLSSTSRLVLARIRGRAP